MSFLEDQNKNHTEHIPVPVPVPIQTDTRDHVVSHNLLGTIVTWSYKQWTPHWTHGWRDLLDTTTTTFTGKVCAVIETQHGLELLVQLTNGQITRAPLRSVRVVN